MLQNLSTQVITRVINGSGHYACIGKRLSTEQRLSVIKSH